MQNVKLSLQDIAQEIEKTGFEPSSATYEYPGYISVYLKKSDEYIAFGYDIDGQDGYSWNDENNTNLCGYIESQETPKKVAELFWEGLFFQMYRQ